MHLTLPTVLSLLCTPLVQAAIPPKPVPPPLAARKEVDHGSATFQQFTFQQLIDHSNPSLGTFSQRYWFNAEWWKGEGSPVLLHRPHI